MLLCRVSPLLQRVPLRKQNDDVFGRAIMKLYLKGGRISTTVARLLLVTVFLMAATS